MTVDSQYRSFENFPRVALCHSFHAKLAILNQEFDILAIIKPFGLTRIARTQNLSLYPASKTQPT